MDEFQKKFIDEATDLINELENALLLLENHPNDKSIIERVFRVMHSLKGGGSMFGFDSISQFTHNLETIYDLIRNGKMDVNSEVLNITLASVDHLKLLIKKGENLNSDEIKSHKQLIDNILLIINENAYKIVKVSPRTSNLGETEVLRNKATYLIYFKPSEYILLDGTNPLYLLDELATFGNAYVIAHTEEIPQFQIFDCNKCYTHWVVILSTVELENALKDVFIFVQGDAELIIIKLSESDLLEDRNFVKKLQDLTHQSTPKNLEELLEFSKSLAYTEFSGQNVQIDQKIDLKENTISSIRVDSAKIDILMNLVSELVTTQASLSLFMDKNKLHDLNIISENVENLTRQLREVAFSISLVPIETILTRFQRLVRDLSAEFKKEIEFVIEGSDTELDKTLIQNLIDPIMHILRNSIDHGIESKEERINKGKSPKGIIHFKAFYSGAMVHIEIQDDGAGINTNRIKEKAIQKEIVTAEAIHSEKDLLNMIFLPGFSTVNVVTGISGRGVGMDVVKRKINEVRGEVDVESEVDKGTIITIKIPLTLSIIDGLLVKIDDINYIVPLSVVEKIFAIKHVQISNKFGSTVILDGEQIAFYYLRDEFDCTNEALDDEQLIVVKYKGNRIGLVVDTVIGEYQAVLKPLGYHYKNHEIISGATILGDGSIALVIDTNKIIKQFSNEISK